MSKSMYAWSQENAEEIPILLREYLNCPVVRDALRVDLGNRIAAEGGEVTFSVDGCIKITMQITLPEKGEGVI